MNVPSVDDSEEHDELYFNQFTFMFWGGVNVQSEMTAAFLVGGKRRSDRKSQL